jgi:hypothetical protein
MSSTNKNTQKKVSKKRKIQQTDIINVDIDLRRCPWILNIPDEMRLQKIHEYLKVGHLVSNTMQMSINPMGEVFQPIIEKMSQTKYEMGKELQVVQNKMECISKDNGVYVQRMTTMMESLGKGSYTSSLKGKIGESIIEQVVNDFFKEDDLQNTCKIPRSGDYQLHFKDGFTIMLEIKIYKHKVDSKEVAKFIRDLKYQKMSGILISLSSDIVKKRKLEIQEIDDGNIAVFASSVGLNGAGIIWTVLLLREILRKKKKLGSVYIDTDKIMGAVKQFQDHYKVITQLNYNIRDARKTINNKMDNLAQQGLNAEIELRCLLERLTETITSELHQIDTDLEQFTVDDQTVFLDKLRKENSKLVKNYDLLFKMFTKRSKLTMVKSDKCWMIQNKKDKELIADVRHSKTKLELRFLCKKVPKMIIEVDEGSATLIKTNLKKCC